MIHIMANLTRWLASISKADSCRISDPAVSPNFRTSLLGDVGRSLKGNSKEFDHPTKHSKFSIVAELLSGIGGPSSPKMDHFVCFFPGFIALGATNRLSEIGARRIPNWNVEKFKQMRLARELMKTC